MCSRERELCSREKDVFPERETFPKKKQRYERDTEREHLYNPQEKELHSNQTSIIKQFENLESTVQIKINWTTPLQN